MNPCAYSEICRMNKEALDNANDRISLLTEAIKAVLWINECRCDEGYTSRKMHGPNSLCGELDELIEILHTGPKPE